MRRRKRASPERVSCNLSVRRFLRREADEVTVHQRLFRPFLRLIPYHMFAKLAVHPHVEVVEITNFQERFGSDPEQVAVRWETCAVGYDEGTRLITEAHLFGVHRKLGDLQFVAVLGPEPGGEIHLNVIVRNDDIDRLQPLLDWLETLEELDHPLKGRLFSLSEESLAFLPPQGVTRDDVILPAELVDEVERNFAFLEKPQDFPPALRHRALLLAGPPGVGKTLMSRWLSSRYGCTGLWVTAKALFSLGPAVVFHLARQLRPTLLILEDIDVAAGRRDGTQPLGELLGQLDGFERLEDVAVLGTTNHPEALDRALDPNNRPGRFHRLLRVGPPQDQCRQRMLERLLNGSAVLEQREQPLVDRLVELTEGCTGAQIAELVHDLESRALWRRRKGESVDLPQLLDDPAGLRPPVNRQRVGFAAQTEVDTKTA